MQSFSIVSNIFEYMESLSRIPIEQLAELRNLYKTDWPLHISTHSTIQLFIDRFAKFPRWIDKVTFLSLRDDWRTCGAFIMIHETRIFFNTLESYPFNKLKKALMLIQVDDVMTFVNIRDNLR